MARNADDYACDELLEDLSQQVRQTYVDCRRKIEEERKGVPSHYQSCARWDGVRTRKEDTTQLQPPVWPKIVRFALSHGLDPVQYVSDMMFILSVRKICPMPPQLHGRWAEDVYFQAFPKDLRQQSVEDAFQAQRVALSCKITDFTGLPGWTFEKIRRHVITDPDVQLSALFRYCCAVEAGLTDVAARYRAAALRQYSLNSDAYDAVWGAWLPDEVKASGRRLKERIARLVPPGNYSASADSYRTGY